MGTEIQTSADVAITKEKMCRMLYGLNWHIKDICAETSNPALSSQERALLRERLVSLRELKEKVLAKLVIDGHAVIRGVQKDMRFKPRKYYSIRLTRDYSFHLPMKEFKELLMEYEKTGDASPAGKTENEDI